MPVERVKPRPIELCVEERVMESPDTVTLVFATTPETLSYRAGQFLTIDPRQFAACRPALAYLEHQKGKREMPRAYSMASAPHEPRLAITIKEESYEPGTHPHPPLLSPFLVHACFPGVRMTAVGFTGPYTLPPDVEQRTGHILHIVAGSGAVPNYSMLKDSLHRHPKLRHTFLSSNRSWADICFRDSLLALERAHPDRLKVINTLTRQEDFSGTTGTVRQGRVTAALLEELLPDPGTAFAYVCGPAITAWERRAALESKTAATPRFLESTLQLLLARGLTPDRVKRESYG